MDSGWSVSNLEIFFNSNLTDRSAFRGRALWTALLVGILWRFVQGFTALTSVIVDTRLIEAGLMVWTWRWLYVSAGLLYTVAGVLLSVSRILRPVCRVLLWLLWMSTWIVRMSIPFVSFQCIASLLTVYEAQKDQSDWWEMRWRRLVAEIFNLLAHWTQDGKPTHPVRSKELH